MSDSNKKAKPPVVGVRVTTEGFAGGDARIESYEDYKRQSASVSIPALLVFADLQLDLGFFYLDKAESILGIPPLTEFNRWFFRFVDCVTWAEILRQGRDGHSVSKI